MTGTMATRATTKERAGSMALRQQALPESYSDVAQCEGSRPRGRLPGPGQLRHDFPVEADKPVQFALEQPLLIAVRAVALGTVFAVHGGTDPETPHGLPSCDAKRTSTVGSLTTSFTRSRNLAGSSSGSIRTSSVALASDGMTFER